MSRAIQVFTSRTVPKLIHEMSQPRFNRLVHRHPACHVREHARFQNNAAVNQLFGIGIQQTGVKPEVFRHAPHVNSPDRQPDPGLRFHYAEKLERLRRFANAEPTDAKRLRELGLGRQSITRHEFLGDDVLLDLCGGLIADFGTTKRLHSGPRPRLWCEIDLDKLSDNQMGVDLTRRLACRTISSTRRFGPSPGGSSHSSACCTF